MATPTQILRYLFNLRNYFKYEVIYLFDRDLTAADQAFAKAKTDQGALIRINSKQDLGQYDLSAFAFLRSILSKDALWQGGVLFLYTVDNKPAHLSWVALKNFAAYSDPYFKNSKNSEAGYIGPCFTLEEFRGLSIYPHVLGRICQYLKEQGKTRAQILTRQSHPASVRGIEKAGFTLTAEITCIRVLFRDFYRLKRRV